MIGGIYCEASLGPIYDNGVLLSVRQRMQRLFGVKNVVPKGDTLNEQIINYWYSDISKKMSKILSSWKVPVNRGYYNRTVDLTRSICLGVYHNGKLKRMYRFTGGNREKGMADASEWGSNSSVISTLRMEILAQNHHPDPAARAKQFLEEYDLIYKKDFSIVIAATMPYAVRLEYNGVGNGSKTNYGGYGIPVIRDVVNRMLVSVYDFKKQNTGGVYYGYVFETGGRFES